MIHILHSTFLFFRSRWFRYLSLSLFSILILIPEKGTSQVYFQYEHAGTTKVRRYVAGDEVIFRTKKFGDAWLKGRIERILPEDNALVFYDRISYLDDITYYQYERGWAKGTGVTLMRFGGSWLLFGGAIEGLRRADVIDTSYEFGADTAIIGLGSIAIGYLTKSLWSTAIKKVNDRNRVRIIDVRF